MIISRAYPLAFGLALAAAATPAIAKDRPDPYVAKGEAVTCIPIRSIRSTNVRDDRTIDFETAQWVGPVQDDNLDTVLESRFKSEFHAANICVRPSAYVL